MTILSWLTLQLLPMLGFLLAILLVFRLLRERRSPSSTLAWLLVTFLVPYVGVPLYLIFGGRKMKRMAARKVDLPRANGATQTADITADTDSVSTVDGLFPVRPGNDVTVLMTGEEAYSSLVDMVEHAHTSIAITTFILGRDTTGDALLDLLCRKAAEGVHVRLLLDALGSRAVTKRHLARLADAGGNYAFFMPMLHLPFRGRANLRNHRKMLIVDNKTAIIGGMNLANNYMGPRGDIQRWRDISLQVRRPVVGDMYDIFRSDWAFASGEELDSHRSAGADDMSAEGFRLQVAPSGPDVNGDPLHETMLTSIFKARRRLWAVTPYFIPDEMLLKALCIAAKRGVDVRIIVPRVSNHRLADIVRRSYLREVQEAGASVYYFGEGMLHGKAIIIEGSTAVIGSINMDVRSFFLNYEVALFIHSAKGMRLLNAWMRQVMRASVEGVERSPFFVEIVEGVSRLFAPLL